MTALPGTVVGMPVVVHYIREDGALALAEFLRPGAPSYIPDSHQGSIERKNRGCQSVLFQRDPMLHGKPLKPCSGNHVPRRVHDPILDLVVKLWPIHGKRKRKIDPLLGEDLLLVKIVCNFDLLLVGA